MFKIGPGGKLLLVIFGVAILLFTADRYFGRQRFMRLLGLTSELDVRLTSGDFPAGAAAPVGDLVAMPLRPLRVAAVPRGSTASLLLAAGGTGLHRDAPASRSYGLDLELALLPDEASVAQALASGGDSGGADAAVLSVDRLAQLRETRREAKLKAVLLMSRSRGHEAIAAARGIDQVAALKGKKIAVPRASPSRYLLMWALTQAVLSPSAVTLLPVSTPSDAAELFMSGRVDAAAGSAHELGPLARDRGGRLIATSGDAPHLIANVLVVRNGVIARYPDAVRRLVRSVLDSAEAIGRDQTDAARALSVNAPSLGDPLEALKVDPPASLTENLAFFGVRGDIPVRYEEIFGSAAALWKKIGEPADVGSPADARELGPLIAAAATAATAPPGGASATAPAPKP